ncbi:hypothetical protein GJB61_31090 [Paenibacillus sp. LC-T2]|uniref:Transposase IS701-like DDE domain-containing protein n=1 Tax=Paenibacillus monticola TaxID=2666075 RepID=A0A7X2HCV3_9BACL|nr:hypothetical protein [Paenibacillus monticola]
MVSLLGYGSRGRKWLFIRLGLPSLLSKRRIARRRLPFKSKNDLALEITEAFSAQEDERVYVLMDSWYTSEKVINACNRKGFHVIAALKTNRRIRPAGVSLPLDDFAERYIRKSDLHSVTVEGQGTYWIYPYEDRSAISKTSSSCCPVRTRTPLRAYGFVFGSRYDSEILRRTLEHRDGVSLLQRTAGLRSIPIAFLYGHSAFLGDPVPDTKRSGVSAAGMDEEASRVDAW